MANDVVVFVFGHLWCWSLEIMENFAHVCAQMKKCWRLWDQRETGSSWTHLIPVLPLGSSVQVACCGLDIVCWKNTHVRNLVVFPIVSRALVQPSFCRSQINLEINRTRTPSPLPNRKKRPGSEPCCVTLVNPSGAHRWKNFCGWCQQLNVCGICNW